MNQHCDVELTSIARLYFDRIYQPITESRFQS